MTFKIAIYVRVSKRDMHPENQERQLIEEAKRKGWEYEVFTERESSRDTRPIKEDVLFKLRHREFDGLLIWKLDRWARSLQEIILETDEFRMKGIDFIVYGTPIDTTTATGRLFIQLLGAFAEFEREIIRERTKAGIDRAKSQGKIRGRHPVGCGCGMVGNDGKKHDGPIKPVRDEKNMIIGWNQTGAVPPPTFDEGHQPEKQPGV